MAVDNHDIVYQFDDDPNLSPDEVAFNDQVFSQTADPQARNRNGLAQLPVTTGDIRVPFVTVHKGNAPNQKGPALPVFFWVAKVRFWT